MMQKEEFYNACIEMYRKTGQGVPGFVRLKMDSEIIDELIKEGKLKSITHHYSYLPDDEWLCLTGVYCVEEEMQNGGVSTRALNFLRRYMEIPQDSPFDKKVEDFLNKNPKEREKVDGWYNDWLNEHREELKRSFSSLDSMEMQIPLTPSKLSIDKDFLEYINGFNLDSSINEMESLMYRRNILHKELIMLLERKIQINPGKATKEECEKDEEELKISKREYEYDLKIQKMLQRASSFNNLKEYLEQKYELNG